MITLYNDDCIKVMKDIPDESVDLILTDPPYKMNHSTGGCTNMEMKNKWNGNIKAGNIVVDFNTDIKFYTWIPEIFRILKPKSHCYIFCNDKNIQEMLNELEKAGFKESNLLVWVKNNATPNRYYMKNVEFVIFCYKGGAKPITNMGSKCAVSVNNIHGKNKLHPTEKPVELLSSYILNSTNENDVVFDPFMGSGSTGVACINNGRNFIGIEIDKRYFDIAKKRISENK